MNFFLDRYRNIAQELYEESEKDIIIGTFDNTDGKEIEPHGTPDKIIISYQKLHLLQPQLSMTLIAYDYSKNL